MSLMADTTTANAQVRTLSETVRLDARTKLLNPKFYEGMLATGYEGVREIQKRLRLPWDGLPLLEKLTISCSKMLMTHLSMIPRCRQDCLIPTRMLSVIWSLLSWKRMGEDTGILLKIILKNFRNCMPKSKTELKVYRFY